MFWRNNTKKPLKNSKSASRTAGKLASKVVSETQWVHRNQLKLGMYVNELDRPWQETKFIFQGFWIDTPEILFAVQESCEYANVRTEKVAYMPSNSTHRLVAATK
ncbi:MAG: DUF3391 domain-containing protein [Granulosicoccus sp.]|nr:DUF3391 domain-containing protein [Granulosicoccus sp.]